MGAEEQIDWGNDRGDTETESQRDTQRESANTTCHPGRLRSSFLSSLAAFARPTGRERQRERERERQACGVRWWARGAAGCPFAGRGERDEAQRRGGAEKNKQRKREPAPVASCTPTAKWGPLLCFALVSAQNGHKRQRAASVRFCALLCAADQPRALAGRARTKVFARPELL